MSFKALAGGSHGLTPRARPSLDVRDDRSDAAGAEVLTYRFWITVQKQRSIGDWQPGSVNALRETTSQSRRVRVAPRLCIYWQKPCTSMTLGIDSPPVFLLNHCAPPKSSPAP